MPELPEVETVRAGLAASCLNRTIKRAQTGPQKLRFPWPAGLCAGLAGRTITSVGRRGKYLLIHLSDGWIWLVHLGMTGSFRLERADAPRLSEPHDHVRVDFTDGMRLIYNDPRRFGFMDRIAPNDLATNRFLCALGPEPFDRAFNAGYLLQRLKRRSGPIKPALMDAALVVGVGNIYASEALFHAGIDPCRPARTLMRSEGAALVRAVRAVLRAAIQSGGSTLRNYTGVDGVTGRFQHHFAVYDRAGQACPSCVCSVQQTGGIHKTTQAGRSTFYCPHKQQ